MEPMVLKPKRQKKSNGNQSQIIIKVMSELSSERDFAILEDISKNNSILQIFENSKTFDKKISLKSKKVDSYSLAI